MRYFLDTEFNGLGGELISLALVGEGQFELYVAREFKAPFVPWVQEHVRPVIQCSGAIPSYRAHFATDIEQFLMHDPDPVIVADWPDDIAYFCQCLIVGPGRMIHTAERIKFEVHRVDAYPTDLPNAVQHNALWDARALRRKVAGK